MAPFYWLFVFTEVFSGALRGMGDVVVPMLITTGGICLFRVVWIFGVVALFPDAHRNAPQLSGVLGFNIRSVSVLLSFPDEKADRALIAPASLTSLAFCEADRAACHRFP